MNVVLRLARRLALVCFPRLRRRPSPIAGFTLIELLVVLVILGLLSAFVAPQVLNYLGRAKTDAAQAQIQNIASILDLYRLDTGRYPSEQEGLDALLEAPPDATAWNGPYVKRADALIDPWGEMYRYRFPGEHGDYDLFTLGADQAEGGDGENQDVTSW
ncbi:MAG: type II secretion system major pseudopilin GspG [Geminicoccaceae bacterium]|nr:type II secretion system major pseudopilin GspG [Geminicoccaceae bacterium]